jgi:cell division initiation protein
MSSKPMKLTALEIKQQQFEKSLRGYDVAEVQAYLNLISNEWEHLTGRVRDLETQIDKMNDKLKHYERVEEALHETLQTAKDSAEQKLTGARKEAKNIVEKAEIEADSIVREANQQRQQIRQSILRLLDRREEIISGIRSYLEIAQDSLQQFSKDEASLFSLPKEPKTDLTDDLSLNDDENNSSGSRKKSSPDGQDKELKSTGPQSLDDILDELD